MTTEYAQRIHRALNRLCHWRKVLAGRFLGTTPDTDPRYQALRDLIDAKLIMRVELSALTRALIDAGLLAPAVWTTLIEEEAALLSKEYEQEFQGFSVNDVGLVIRDADMAVKTTKDWPP